MTGQDGEILVMVHFSLKVIHAVFKVPSTWRWEPVTIYGPARCLHLSGGGRVPGLGGILLHVWLSGLLVVFRQAH